MSQPNPASNATRVAIECLTLWIQPGTEARYRAAEHIERLQNGPDGPGPTVIITGMLNLSMLLLAKVAHLEGAGDIGERAGEILQEISPQLPE